MINMLKNLHKEESGQDLIEYALVAGDNHRSGSHHCYGCLGYRPSADLSASLISCSTFFAFELTTASATPIAAATPMAGAPLITIVRIASATPCQVS